MEPENPYFFKQKMLTKYGSNNDAYNPSLAAIPFCKKQTAQPHTSAPVILMSTKNRIIEVPSNSAWYALLNDCDDKHKDVHIIDVPENPYLRQLSKRNIYSLNEQFLTPEMLEPLTHEQLKTLLVQLDYLNCTGAVPEHNHLLLRHYLKQYSGLHTQHSDYADTCLFDIPQGNVSVSNHVLGLILTINNPKNGCHCGPLRDKPLPAFAVTIKGGPLCPHDNGIAKLLKEQPWIRGLTIQSDMPRIAKDTFTHVSDNSTITIETAPYLVEKEAFGHWNGKLTINSSNLTVASKQQIIDDIEWSLFKKHAFSAACRLFLMDFNPPALRWRTIIHCMFEACLDTLPTFLGAPQVAAVAGSPSFMIYLLAGFYSTLYCKIKISNYMRSTYPHIFQKPKALTIRFVADSEDNSSPACTLAKPAHPVHKQTRVLPGTSIVDYVLKNRTIHQMPAHNEFNKHIQTKEL